MSNGLQLHLFTCGRLWFDPAVFLPDQGQGKLVAGPVPFYLLEHPSGNVLVDTGCSASVVSDPKAAWGGVSKVFWPEVRTEDLAPEQLRRRGFLPESISRVVCTHLHMDHSGGNRLFPNATFLVHSKELERAMDPQFEGLGYIKDEWRPDCQYVTVDDGFDLFGDGSAVLRSLPGHTPGHLGLLAQLDNDGTVMLAVDEAPLRANLDGRLVPKNSVDQKESLSSLNYLAELENSGARVICGHDPEQWEQLPHRFS